MTVVLAVASFKVGNCELCGKQEAESRRKIGKFKVSKRASSEKAGALN